MGIEKTNDLVLDALLSKLARHKMHGLYSRMRKPVENEVISAAAVFYKKFFIQNSPMDFDPCEILVSAISLACKTEEYHNIQFRDLNSSESNPDDVTALELKILMSANFDVEIAQPWPILLLFASRLSERGKPDAAQKVFESSCELLSAWIWTGLVLRYPLPVLGVCAIWHTSRDYGVTESVSAVFTEEFGTGLLKSLMEASSTIQAYMQQLTELPPDELERLSRMLVEARSDDSRKRRKQVEYTH